jgi:hypothetical protein
MLSKLTTMGGLSLLAHLIPHPGDLVGDELARPLVAERCRVRDVEARYLERKALFQLR